MNQNTQRIVRENEPYEVSGDCMVEALRSAGTTGEKILHAAALSFAQGIIVGRSARMADETADVDQTQNSPHKRAVYGG